MSLAADLRAVERRMALIAHEGGAAVPAAADVDAFAGATARANAALPAIDRAARTAGLDPALVEAVVAKESAFDARATSRAGAQGLMQLVPATAAALGVDDPYDVAQNVRGGTTYLRQLLDRFGGNVSLALAAYNAGPAAVERYGGMPPYAETRAYVHDVLAHYRERGAHRIR